MIPFEQFLSPNLDTIPPGSLYPHQADGVAFLLSRRRAILADDMGLGKTRQAIVAAARRRAGGPFLVVCPASVKLNWRREIRMVEPGADVQVVGGGPRAVRARRWTVVNYDLARQHPRRCTRHRLGRDHRRRGPLHQERRAGAPAHASSCSGSGRARAALSGPRAAYLLTGTPMANRPRDLFNLLRCVGHPSARSFLGFAKRYCAAYHNGYGWTPTAPPTSRSCDLVCRGSCSGGPRTRRSTSRRKLAAWVPVDVSGSAAALKAIESVPELVLDDRSLAARTTRSSWAS